MPTPSTLWRLPAISAIRPATWIDPYTQRFNAALWQKQYPQWRSWIFQKRTRRIGSTIQTVKNPGQRSRLWLSPEGICFVGSLLIIEITNIKSQISNNFQGPKFENPNNVSPWKVLVIEYWILRFICNLVLGICDFRHKTPRQSHLGRVCPPRTWSFSKKLIIPEAIIFSKG